MGASPTIVERLRALLDGVSSALTGEPARVIGYGGAVVIYLVAKALGAIPDQSFDQAIGEATAAIVIVASLVETIRRYVFSAQTVKAIVAENVVNGVAPAILSVDP